MPHHSLLLGASSNGQSCRNYYQILEVSPDERDPRVIEEAALSCSSRVRVYQVARELECARELNEIARALNTLLDLALRREYDLRLAKATVPGEAEPQRPPIPAPSVSLRETGSAPLSGERPLQLLRSEAAKSCDVTLVRVPEARGRLNVLHRFWLLWRYPNANQTSWIASLHASSEPTKTFLSLFQSIQSPALKGASSCSAAFCPRVSDYWFCFTWP